MGQPGSAGRPRLARPAVAPMQVQPGVGSPAARKEAAAAVKLPRVDLEIRHELFHQLEITGQALRHVPAEGRLDVELQVRVQRVIARPGRLPGPRPDPEEIGRRVRSRRADELVAAGIVHPLQQRRGQPVLLLRQVQQRLGGQPAFGGRASQIQRHPVEDCPMGLRLRLQQYLVIHLQPRQGLGQPGQRFRLTRLVRLRPHYQRGRIGIGQLD